MTVARVAPEKLNTDSLPFLSEIGDNYNGE